MMNDKPLTEDEIQELDNFLLDGADLEEAMDIATLDGFLTAIISGPKLIPASEWMRWVWDMEQGKDSPEFESQAQAERIIGLLMRHMNDVAQMLTYSPEQYAPLLMENQFEGDKIPVLDEWCCGFMKGMELDSRGWLPVTAGHPDWLSTILLYGTEEGWDELKRKNLPLDEHKALAARLADSVLKIHAYWLAQRRLVAGSSNTVRSAPKIGRNELCPCGSGKKYKRCHGSAERLH